MEHADSDSGKSPQGGLGGPPLATTSCQASSCSRPRSVRSRFRGLEPATDLRRSGTRTRSAIGNVDCGARPSGSRGMRLVPGDCVWIDAETAGPLAAVWISLAEEPDACDATPRRQDICEERSRGTGPSSLQGRTFMSAVCCWSLVRDQEVGGSNPRATTKLSL